MKKYDEKIILRNNPLLAYSRRKPLRGQCNMPFLTQALLPHQTKSSQFGKENATANLFVISYSYTMGLVKMKAFFIINHLF